MTKHDHEMPVWMPAIRFTVPGIPHAKQRPRFSRLSNGGVKTRTPKATQVYEQSVAWHARALAPSNLLAPAGVPVRVDILAMYPRPKRLAKAPPTMLPKCVSHHGDLDNHVKAILDGLNHARVWKDDGQVQCIRAEAVYAPPGQRPCSTVTLYIPTGLATHKQTTEDKHREILATSATGADSRTIDAQVGQSKSST